MKVDYLTRINGMGGDDYRVHQDLKELFEGRFLFQRNRYEVLVLSEQAPRYTRDFLVHFRNVSGIIDMICEGDELAFSLRVNPVVTKFMDGKNRRLPIEDYRLKEWIGQKLKDAGLEARFVFKTEGGRRSTRKEKTITLSSVMVRGVAKIADIDVFLKALDSGIGHAKGLGYGFLNIFGEDEP
jgi:CRISPR-associated protein Cas6/Cse3/CasE subtype I-E